MIGSISETQKKKLERVHAKALRIFQSASKNPDGSCSSRSGRDPFLNIRQEILAEKYTFKCRKKANGAIINKETEPTWHENATQSYVSR